MSLLHSFYCWGAVGTILVSTVFFLVFGMGVGLVFPVVLLLMLFILGRAKGQTGK